MAADAGFFETLRRVPLGLVVALDLLDLALDVFSAPIIWVVLDRLNLKALRQVATIEALIPISGPIPTMTICWILARRFPDWGGVRAVKGLRGARPLTQREGEKERWRDGEMERGDFGRGGALTLRKPPNA